MLLATSMVPGIILKVLICIIIFFIGITVFSFLNVVSERMTKEGSEKIYEGRSKCPHCGHDFKISESIPIFSWLYNRRKCPYCFEAISMRGTLVECLGGILAVGIVAYYGIGFASLTLFLVAAVLAVITLIDMDTQTIPPVLNVILGGLGLISIFTFPGPSIMERLIGFFCISVPMFLIVLLIPDGFGGGDIKMMAASGIFLGWKGNVAAFVIGLLIGGAYGAWLLLSKKKGRKEHFAFGPCLSIGVFVSAYGGFGAYVVNQYLFMIQTILAG